MKHLVAPFAVIVLVASCHGETQTPTTTTTTTTSSSSSSSGGGGSGGAACVYPPDEVQYPGVFNPQSTCCDDATCRGVCGGLLTGNGQERVTQCYCGTPTFDGKAHHAPPACGEGEECCVLPAEQHLCVPAGQCQDCRPERSTQYALVGCCGAKTACRGRCQIDQMGPCSCEQEGDGGCGEEQECCLHPITGVAACVPWGECVIDLGPCPPVASSAKVATDCCDDFPCFGRCESHPELGLSCNCGGAVGGCMPDEECCLAPSGKNLDPETHCVPAGQCPSGG